MRPLALAAVLLLPALAGCSAPPQVASIGCSERAEVSPDIPLPPAENLTFATGDGVELHGAWWQGSAVRAALLVHGLNEDRHPWGPLVDRLWHKGWTVMTFDLRGHGESRTRGGHSYELRNFTREDFLAVEQDVATAASLVEGRLDPRGDGRSPCLVLAGASLGANAALRVAAAEAALVKAVALLSPGEEYRGLRTDDVAGRVADKPLFLGAARGDAYAAEAAQNLANGAGRDTLVLVAGDAHGTNLLRVPEFQPRLVAWFDALP